MKKLFFFLSLLSGAAACAQQPASGNDIKKFIPAGYEVRDSVSGDLNGDNIPDLVLVLQQKTPASDTADRPLLLLLGDSHHHWSLAARNKDLIYPADIGGTLGDPYVQTTIDHGCVTIEQYYGSRERTRSVVTFCYQPKTKDWILQQVAITHEDALHADAAKTTIKKGKQLKPISIRRYAGEYE